MVQECLFIDGCGRRQVTVDRGREARLAHRLLVPTGARATSQCLELPCEASRAIEFTEGSQALGRVRKEFHYARLAQPERGDGVGEAAQVSMYGVMVIGDRARTREPKAVVTRVERTFPVRSHSASART